MVLPIQQTTEQRNLVSVENRRAYVESIISVRVPETSSSRENTQAEDADSSAEVELNGSEDHLLE